MSTHQHDTLPPELFPTFPVCWATLTGLETEGALDELEDWAARTGCRPGEHRPDR